MPGEGDTVMRLPQLMLLVRFRPFKVVLIIGQATGGRAEARLPTEGKGGVTSGRQ